MLNDSYTNVITIRQYKDGSLALCINGRDYPHLAAFDVDLDNKHVQLDIGYGVLNILDGDEELPRPEPIVDATKYADLDGKTLADCKARFENIDKYGGDPFYRGIDVTTIDAPATVNMPREEERITVRDVVEAALPVKVGFLRKLAKVLRHR